MQKMERNLANRLFLAITIIYYLLIIGLNVLNMYVDLGMNMAMNIMANESLIVAPAIVTMFIWFIKSEYRETVDETFVRESMFDRLMFRRIKWSTLLMTILFVILISPLATLANAISLLFVENEVVESSVDVVGLPFGVMLFLIAIMGPIFEEIAFRGVIFGGYRKSCSLLAAVLTSALTFGLMHMNFNQMSYALVLGIAFALINEASGSIWCSIICHILINAKTTVALYITDSDMLELAQTDDYLSNNEMFVMIAIYAIVAVITTTLAVCALTWIAHNEGRQNPMIRLIHPGKERGLGVWTPSLIIAIVLSLTFMICELLV